MSEKRAIIPTGQIEQRILLIRGQKVMLDTDLAELYGVTTKRLNEQVKRNRNRFPQDFMFRLTVKEKAEVVANCDHLAKLKFSPVLPNVFYRARSNNGGECSQHEKGYRSKCICGSGIYQTSRNACNT
ncbi:MAG: ORF6N domain-containing protein [Thermodesulfobacteriota bacterium]